MTTQLRVHGNGGEGRQLMLHRLRRSPWNKGAIAKLTTSAIEHLPAEDLVEIIAQMSSYLPQRVGRKRLEFSERATLERLAFLARRCCRHQGY